ncbi:hypothetical protein AB0915_33100, partial [Streptomyces sp. NPDC048411]
MPSVLGLMERREARARQDLESWTEVLEQAQAEVNAARERVDRAGGGTCSGALSRWLTGWDDLLVDHAGGDSSVESASPSYRGHRYPVEVISHCVWLYFRFLLSFREVEELMLQRGVIVSHETVR